MPGRAAGRRLYILLERFELTENPNKVTAKALKQRYFHLAKERHPDAAPHNLKEEAEKNFVALQNQYEEARNLLEKGVEPVKVHSYKAGASSEDTFRARRTAQQGFSGFDRDKAFRDFVFYQESDTSDYTFRAYSPHDINMDAEKAESQHSEPWAHSHTNGVIREFSAWDSARSKLLLCGVGFGVFSWYQWRWYRKKTGSLFGPSSLPPEADKLSDPEKVVWEMKPKVQGDGADVAKANKYWTGQRVKPKTNYTLVKLLAETDDNISLCEEPDMDKNEFPVLMTSDEVVPIIQEVADERSSFVASSGSDFLGTRKLGPILVYGYSSDGRQKLIRKLG